MDLELAQLSALERYKLLIGLVIPRPIAWVSTWSENGIANCAPFSFLNVISEDPPLCILSFNWRSKVRRLRRELAPDSCPGTWRAWPRRPSRS